MKLNCGERERIAIARVLLQSAPIMILDETTANLDGVERSHRGPERYQSGKYADNIYPPIKGHRTV